MGLARGSTCELARVSADAERDMGKQLLVPCRPLWSTAPPGAQGLWKDRWAGRQHRKRGLGEKGDTPLDSDFSLQLPILKTPHFRVTSSQRGIGAANFISLDPSSLQLQQAGGRKPS